MAYERIVPFSPLCRRKFYTMLYVQQHISRLGWSSGCNGSYDSMMEVILQSVMRMFPEFAII